MLIGALTRQSKIIGREAQALRQELNSHGGIMQRRDVLKMLATGAVLPVFSSPMVAFFREAQAQTGPGYKLRTLNPHQNATVVVLTDLIIPETDTPGAKAARVNEFIDVILTEWATEAERLNFLAGLAGIDKQSQELFGKDFVDATPQQQVTLLRALDDYATTERGEYHQKHGNTVPQLDAYLKGNFYDIFRGITLHGYYTSEIGFTQELRLQIIPGAHHGCEKLGPGLGGA
jgi:gluconate 2-dehydrogenase gamma chain